MTLNQQVEKEEQSKLAHQFGPRTQMFMGELAVPLMEQSVTGASLFIGVQVVLLALAAIHMVFGQSVEFWR